MTKKKLKLNNFVIDSPENEKDYCFNFAPSKKLKQSLGIINLIFNYTPNPREMNVPASVNKILGISHFCQFSHNSLDISNRLFIYGDDKKLYLNQMFSSSYMFVNMYSLSFENAPVCLTYRNKDIDVAVFASDDKMYVWKSNRPPYQLSDAPIVTSMCVNGQVLFCALKKECYKIWYTRELEIDDIVDEVAGKNFITLDVELGFARKLITLEDKTYIFRDYGISKISLYKDEIEVSEVFKTNTLICPNTICACGSNILFFTSEGLFSFNGTRVVKCELNLTGLKPVLDNAMADSLGQKYYLALKLDFNDGLSVGDEQNEGWVNNALLVVDCSDFSFQIVRGVDILKPLALKTLECEKLLVIFNTGNVRKIGEVIESSKYYDIVLPKLWRKTNVLDTNNNKLVTKLIVKSDKDVVFNLIFDGVSHQFKTTKSGHSEFYFKTYCKCLDIEISCQIQDALVESVEVEYYDC